MRGRDVVIGCGLGCLGLAVLGVASCVGFRLWLESPAELLEPERLFAADASGHVELRLSLEDPSTARFVEEMLAQTDPPELGELPRWARPLVGLQSRRRARQVREMLPAVLAWTLTSGPEGEDEHLLSLSSEGIGNRLTLARWLLGLFLRRSGDVRVVEYRGESLLRLPPSDGADPTVVLRRGDLHFASSPQAAERAVDRLLDGPVPEAGPASPLERWFGALPAERPLRGAVSNERGELERLVHRLEAETEGEAEAEDLSWLSGVRALTVTGEFAEGPSLDGTLELRCSDARWAEAHAGALADLVRRDWGQVRLSVGDPQVIGERVRLGFTLSAPPSADAERQGPQPVEAAPGDAP